MAEEANASAGDNGACSNGGNRADKCGGNERCGARAGVSPRRDPFAMDIDHGRNCYACGGFRHMARNCRNWGMRGRVGENRRVEYGGGQIEEIMDISNNLKGAENLELLN